MLREIAVHEAMGGWAPLDAASGIAYLRADRRYVYLVPAAVLASFSAVNATVSTAAATAMRTNAAAPAVSPAARTGLRGD